MGWWHRARLGPQGCAYEEAVRDDITVKARCSARLCYLARYLSFSQSHLCPCTIPARPPSLAGSGVAPRSTAVHPLASPMLSLQGRLRGNPNRPLGRVRQSPELEKFLEAGVMRAHSAGVAEQQLTTHRGAVRGPGPSLNPDHIRSRALLGFSPP